MLMTNTWPPNGKHGCMPSGDKAWAHVGHINWRSYHWWTIPVQWQYSTLLYFEFPTNIISCLLLLSGYLLVFWAHICLEDPPGDSPPFPELTTAWSTCPNNDGDKRVNDCKAFDSTRCSTFHCSRFMEENMVTRSPSENDNPTIAAIPFGCPSQWKFATVLYVPQLAFCGTSLETFNQCFWSCPWAQMFGFVCYEY